MDPAHAIVCGVNRRFYATVAEPFTPPARAGRGKVKLLDYAPARRPLRVADIGCGNAASPSCSTASRARVSYRVTPRGIAGPGPQPHAALAHVQR